MNYSVDWDGPGERDREIEEYPVSFYARKDDLFGWWVYSIYEDGIHRREVGPFWRKVSALRVEGALIKNYRTGFDMGAKA